MVTPAAAPEAIHQPVVTRPVAISRHETTHTLPRTSAPAIPAKLTREVPRQQHVSERASTAEPTQMTTASMPRPVVPANPANEVSNEVPRRRKPILSSPVGDRSTHWTSRQMEARNPHRTASRVRSGIGIESARNDARPNQPHPLVVAARQMTKAERMRAIASRPNLIGFKGFCPVELRDNRTLLNAGAQFYSNYGTRTYYFSSTEAKTQFDQDPSRYVPAAGGDDVVLMAHSGEQLCGRLDYAAWYKNRLYLFTSAESLNAFRINPSRYAELY